MEAVNGVSEVDKGGQPPPSPLTGCYLLIVIDEPHCSDHKDIILQRVAKGLLSWDVNNCLVDLEKELAIITEQGLDGEEARYGERLIQFASENLVTEILIHPVVSTLAQCVRNLLSSFTRHRHIIHAGYTFAANGSWLLQDGTFSLADFSEAFQEIEVLRVIRAYENGISLDIHCAPEGDWNRLSKESFTRSCKLRVNPNDVLTSGSPAITSFIDYISPFLIPTNIESLLESSDVVGNIRFSRPTLYVFPGGQGDAALFGINGFNMLLDGGFSRKACFWDFVRHLDRLDAVLLTRLNNSNVNGISAVLKRKKQNAVYPQIGHFFCNIQERKALLSPDGDKDKDPLLINLLEEGQEIVSNLRYLNLTPQVCYRDSEPINLYHKVGHGTLDMYVLSPAKDSKEVREFLQKWNNNDQKLFANKSNRDFAFPLQNVVSICALLVWQPANPDDTITRILYPGSSPQSKIFEGLDRLKNLEFIKHPVCSEKTTNPSLAMIKSRQTKDSNMLDKILPFEKKMSLDNKREKSRQSDKIVDNTINENKLKNGHQTNGVQSDKVVTEKIVKKSDSTESEKSFTKPKKIIENSEKIEKTKVKTKIDAKPRSESQHRKLKTVEKKPSPTTPKKSVDKVNGDAKDLKPLRTKASPNATPAKSAKDANNRKVIESKTKLAPPKKEAPKQVDKKERKPISRRPKEPVKVAGSPTKKVNGVQKPDSISRRGKLDKEGTTDSSTVSTPSADQENVLKKDISKLTSAELQQLKAQELVDLKEEQEAIKEIEAVFRKGELQKEKPTDLRQVKTISSIDDKIEKEEYLIIEKTEIAVEDIREDETQKHTRDSEESEKQRKLSDEIDKIEIKDLPKIIDAEKKSVETQDENHKITIDSSKINDDVIEASKEVSLATPEDKLDISTDKKVSDKDNEEEIKEVAQESQPDEKCSTNIESGATTTAPTLPEDERIPLDDIKEGHQVIEEKHIKEETKEKEIPTIQLPHKTFENISKLPPVVGIRLDKQSHIRDIVKTPDEVADLPVHEEVDIGNYGDYQITQDHKIVDTKDIGDISKEAVKGEFEELDANIKKETISSTMHKVEIESQKPNDKLITAEKDVELAETLQSLEHTPPSPMENKNINKEDENIELKHKQEIPEIEEKIQQDKKKIEKPDSDEKQELLKNTKVDVNDKGDLNKKELSKSPDEEKDKDDLDKDELDKKELGKDGLEKNGLKGEKIDVVDTKLSKEIIEPKEDEIELAEKPDDIHIKVSDISEKKPISPVEVLSLHDNDKQIKIDNIVESMQDNDKEDNDELLEDKKSQEINIAADAKNKVLTQLVEAENHIIEEKETEKTPMEVTESGIESSSKIEPTNEQIEKDKESPEVILKGANALSETGQICIDKRSISEDDEVVSDERNDVGFISSFQRKIEADFEKPTKHSQQLDEQKIQVCKHDLESISTIDEKLQKMKDAIDFDEIHSRPDISTEIVTVDHKIDQIEHAETVIIPSESNPETPIAEKNLETDLKAIGEQERVSPKEPKGDVAEIVASVAVVLKSDAPLEEFEGKVPLASYQPTYTSYTTELRETHITTLDSPVLDENKTLQHEKDDIKTEEPACVKSSTKDFVEEAKKFADTEIESESKATNLLKDSNELIAATSKMISEIKQIKPDNLQEQITTEAAKDEESDVGVVHRMLVTTSSEDGGEEIEICPPGTITFPKSSESSGRSSPDNQSQKLSQKSSIIDTASESITTIKTVIDPVKELDSTTKQLSDDELKTDDIKTENIVKELTTSIDQKVESDIKGKEPKPETLDAVETDTNGIKDKIIDQNKTVEASNDLTTNQEHQFTEILDTTTDVAKKERHEDLSDAKDSVKEIDMNLEKSVIKKTIVDKAETIVNEVISNGEKIIIEKEEAFKQVNNIEKVSPNISASVSKEDDEALKNGESLDAEIEKQVAVKTDDIQSELLNDKLVSSGSLEDDKKETKVLKEITITQISENIPEKQDSHEHDGAKQVLNKHTEDKEVDKIKHEKYDLFNGLEEVGEMVLDVLTADRDPDSKLSSGRTTPRMESGKCSPILEDAEYVKEIIDDEPVVLEKDHQARKGSVTSDISHIVEDLKEDVEDIISKGVKEVKELAKDTTNVVASVIRRLSISQEEDVLQKSADDIKENYDIVTDMTKSVIFEKCKSIDKGEEVVQELSDVVLIKKSTMELEHEIEPLSHELTNTPNVEDTTKKRSDSIDIKSDVKQILPLVSDKPVGIVTSAEDLKDQLEIDKLETVLDKNADKMQESEALESSKNLEQNLSSEVSRTTVLEKDSSSTLSQESKRKSITNELDIEAVAIAKSVLDIESEKLSKEQTKLETDKSDQLTISEMLDETAHNIEDSFNAVHNKGIIDQVDVGLSSDAVMEKMDLKSEKISTDKLKTDEEVVYNESDKLKDTTAEEIDLKADKISADKTNTDEKVCDKSDKPKDTIEEKVDLKSEKVPTDQRKTDKEIVDDNADRSKISEMLENSAHDIEDNFNAVSEMSKSIIFEKCLSPTSKSGTNNIFAADDKETDTDPIFMKVTVTSKSSSDKAIENITDHFDKSKTSNDSHDVENNFDVVPEMTEPVVFEKCINLKLSADNKEISDKDDFKSSAVNVTLEKSVVESILEDTVTDQIKDKNVEPSKLDKQSEDSIKITDLEKSKISDMLEKSGQDIEDNFNSVSDMSKSMIFEKCISPALSPKTEALARKSEDDVDINGICEKVTIDSKSEKLLSNQQQPDIKKDNKLESSSVKEAAKDTDQMETLDEKSRHIIPDHFNDVSDTSGSVVFDKCTGILNADLKSKKASISQIQNEKKSVSPTSPLNIVNDKEESDSVKERPTAELKSDMPLPEDSKMVNTVDVKKPVGSEGNVVKSAVLDIASEKLTFDTKELKEVTEQKHTKSEISQIIDRVENDVEEFVEKEAQEVKEFVKEAKNAIASVIRRLSVQEEDVIQRTAHDIEENYNAISEMAKSIKFEKCSEKSDKIAPFDLDKDVDETVIEQTTDDLKKSIIPNYKEETDKSSTTLSQKVAETDQPIKSTLVVESSTEKKLSVSDVEISLKENGISSETENTNTSKQLCDITSAVAVTDKKQIDSIDSGIGGNDEKIHKTGDEKYLAEIETLTEAPIADVKESLTSNTPEEKLSSDVKKVTDSITEASSETKLITSEHTSACITVSEEKLTEKVTDTETVLEDKKIVESSHTVKDGIEERQTKSEDDKNNEKSSLKSEFESVSTKDGSIAGPSTTLKDSPLNLAKSSTEELHLSGKSTPDIAEVEKIKDIQETLKHEKHIPGSSTPPTVPVSPVVKEISTALSKSESVSVEPKKGLFESSLVANLKESELRSSTPGSDDYEIGVSSYSDISSGQVSRAPNVLDSERNESDDDDDVPGSPMSITSQVAHSRSSSHYDFDDDKISSPKMDPMSMSFYGALPDDTATKIDSAAQFLDDSDLEFEKALEDHRKARGEDLVCASDDKAATSYLYEITKAKYSAVGAPKETNQTSTNNGHQAHLRKDDDLMTSSFIGSELPSASATTSAKDPIESWGKPLGLPSPAPPNDNNKGTPKKERKVPSNVTAKNKLNDDRKRSESPSKYRSKKISPVYVDLTYVPHHGNASYTYVDFFKRIRARYYVFSGTEPSREVYNALLEAKQTWDDKDLEVTIIPTYDTDILGYWVAENEELLTKYKIDLSPSASRCTINLQDHETSCSAYRLEF